LNRYDEEQAVSHIGLRKLRCPEGEAAGPLDNRSAEPESTTGELERSTLDKNTLSAVELSNMRLQEPSLKYILLSVAWFVFSAAWSLHKT